MMTPEQKVIANRERSRRWRERHPDRAREHSRRSVAKWRAAHPEAYLAAARQDYENHKDRYLQKVEGRRRLMEGTVNDLTIKQWNMLKRLCDYRCGHCGGRPDRLEKDHIIPLSKGGAHTLGNIIPSCRSCNRAKSNKLDWISE